MAYPDPATDWDALARDGFARVVRLHPGDYDPSPLVVHCVGGTGRTGTVLACTLRLLGHSTDEAFATVRAHRPDWPESPWQEEITRGSL